MNSIIRLAGICPRTPPLRPMAALEDILERLETAENAGGADVFLLPARALCPPSCGALAQAKTVLAACDEAFSGLLIRSKSVEGCMVLTTLFPGGMQEEITVLHAGECLRFPAHGEETIVFQIGELRFLILPVSPERLPFELPRIAASGCGVVLVPCYEPMPAGMQERMERAVAAVSAASGCAVLCVNGGVGDTSSPNMYSGFAVCADDGVINARESGGMQGALLLYDVDCDTLPQHHTPAVRACFTPSPRGGLLRPLPRIPYLPAVPGERDCFLDGLFTLQTRALCARLDNAGIGRMVLGVSGGLDSTLALLCCANACDMLGFKRTRILAITMPGFGTSDRTYFNALQLMEQLGSETRDISITAAVSHHFGDIGHDPSKRDITYENAQARERAQILFDLANERSGLVVGTGDLSESALGFSTFGGDHLAGYNVNICLNKTTIRALVVRIAEQDLLEGTAQILLDILDTPVSPELLPPAEDGSPEQKSEEILGPYVLHDFFLYYTLRYNLPPGKLLGYARAAFAGEYGPTFIRDKLHIFLRRFYAAQFKRSCTPDAARIMEPNLIGYQIPSDLNAQIFLDELEEEG